MIANWEWDGDVVSARPFAGALLVISPSIGVFSTNVSFLTVMGAGGEPALAFFFGILSFPVIGKTLFYLLLDSFNGYFVFYYCCCYWRTSLVERLF